MRLSVFSTQYRFDYESRGNEGARSILGEYQFRINVQKAPTKGRHEEIGVHHNHMRQKNSDDDLKREREKKTSSES